MKRSYQQLAPEENSNDGFQIENLSAQLDTLKDFTEILTESLAAGLSAGLQLGISKLSEALGDKLILQRSGPTRVTYDVTESPLTKNEIVSGGFPRNRFKRHQKGNPVQCSTSLFDMYQANGVVRERLTGNDQPLFISSTRKSLPFYNLNRTSSEKPNIDLQLQSEISESTQVTQADDNNQASFTDQNLKVTSDLDGSMTPNIIFETQHTFDTSSSEMPTSFFGVPIDMTESESVTVGCKKTLEQIEMEIKMLSAEESFNLLESTPTIEDINERSEQETKSLNSTPEILSILSTQIESMSEVTSEPIQSEESLNTMPDIISTPIELADKETPETIEIVEPLESTPKILSILSTQIESMSEVTSEPIQFEESLTLMMPTLLESTKLTEEPSSLTPDIPIPIETVNKETLETIEIVEIVESLNLMPEILSTQVESMNELVTSEPIQSEEEILETIEIVEIVESLKSMTEILSTQIESSNELGPPEPIRSEKFLNSVTDMMSEVTSEPIQFEESLNSMMSTLLESTKVTEEPSSFMPDMPMPPIETVNKETLESIEIVESLNLMTEISTQVESMNQVTSEPIQTEGESSTMLQEIISTPSTIYMSEIISEPIESEEPLGILISGPTESLNQLISEPIQSREYLNSTLEIMSTPIGSMNERTLELTTQEQFENFSNSTLDIIPTPIESLSELTLKQLQTDEYLPEPNEVTPEPTSIREILSTANLDIPPTPMESKLEVIQPSASQASISNEHSKIVESKLAIEEKEPQTNAPSTFKPQSMFQRIDHIAQITKQARSITDSYKTLDTLSNSVVLARDVTSIEDGLIKLHVQNFKENDSNYSSIDKKLLQQ